MIDRDPQELLADMQDHLRRNPPPDLTAGQLGDLSIRAHIAKVHGQQNVGRCGNRFTTTISSLPVPRGVCALPAGHAGWHRSDEGTEWNDPREPGTTRVEYGVRLHWNDGTTEDMPRASRVDAARTVALHAQKRAEDPGWRATAELICRTVTTSPWTTATEGA